MNICYVSREYLGSKRAGGIATYVHEISRMMQRLGHTIFIICASDDTSKGEQKVIDEVTYIFLPGADFYIHSNRYIQLTLTKIRQELFFNSYRKKIVDAIIRLNNQEGLDIIEFPEFGNEAKFWLQRKDSKIKTIVRFHGPSGHDRERNIIDTKNKHVREELSSSFNADGITFCSEAIRDTLRSNTFASSLLGGFKKKQAIIYNPIVLKNRQFPNPHTANFIFTAGTFVENKGFKELIEAIKMINENDFQIQLMIAGKLGKLGVEYLKKSKQNADYKNWLKIHGPINREALFEYYHNAALCCFPSYWDNMPLTCIEAMSVGGLVLGSSSGGMKEIIDEDVDGFLVEPKDNKLLYKRILSILKLDDDYKSKIKNNAKSKISDSFSEEVIASKMELFYTELMKL